MYSLVFSGLTVVYVIKLKVKEFSAPVRLYDWNEWTTLAENF